MCDYSLHAVASRCATIGDRLVTTSFVGTYTRGFGAANERSVAVCLGSGTELAFDGEVDWDMPFKMFRRKRSLGRLVRFRQIKLGKRLAHHDAIEFPNGTVVLITCLCEGQKATVLQLPATGADRFAREIASGRIFDPSVIDAMSSQRPLADASVSRRG
jgi:hypothetical protein